MSNLNTPTLRHRCATVLIVDDETDVIDLLTFNFSKQGGFTVLHAEDGLTGLQLARTKTPDLMILDLMLPRLDGVELCKILKTDQNTAAIFILMLTAKATAADRILGFEAGADDYVVKPFSPREVVLRASRALVGEPRATHRSMTFGPVTLDESRHLVEVDGRLVSLAGTEFRLLATLMQRPNVVHSRDHLLNLVWSYERALITRTVDTHIRRLRKKLGKSADIVETVRSYGYRLREI